jgi:hypothetical protein
MPRGPSEALVTKFLRDALAVNAVGVPELDEKARAKGLLGERQSITTAKVFKRAKKSLGITSRRTGFGAHSQWFWQMPQPEQQKESSVETRPEAAPARRIPVYWFEGVARLDPDRPPIDKGVSLIPTTAPDYFTEDTPTARLVRQVLGAISEFEKASLVAKLKAARDRRRIAQAVALVAPLSRQHLRKPSR